MVCQYDRGRDPDAASSDLAMMRNYGNIKNPDRIAGALGEGLTAPLAAAVQHSFIVTQPDPCMTGFAIDIKPHFEADPIHCCDLLLTDHFVPVL